MKLSVIVPAYNEALALTKNITNYHQYLDRQGYDFEIIIVNDGSSDNTLAVANALTDKLEKIKIIDLKTNQGKGAAVRSGMLVATGDYSLFLDADNAASIDHLEKAWPLFEQNIDIVIGSRHHRDIKGASQVTPQSAWKRCLGTLGNLLIQVITGIKIWDTQCGFKIFTKQSSKKIFSQTAINRWLFDIEVLLLAKKHDFKIGKIPISWHCDPDSKVGLKGYLISLWEIMKIKYNQTKGQYKK